MNAKRHTLISTLTAATLLAGSLAVAGDAEARRPYREAPRGDYSDYATVVASTPIYEEVNSPRQECWQEQAGYERERERSYGGAIVGGLVGGVLGNQVGKGTGKAVATAVGAATGAIVGDNVNNSGHAASASRPRYEERCRTVDRWERRLTGYDVTYRYQGREYSALMPYDPGNRVRVVVDVKLAD